MLTIVQTIHELYCATRTLSAFTTSSHSGCHRTGQTSHHSGLTQTGLNLSQHCARHEKPDGVLTRSVCVRDDSHGCSLDFAMRPVSVVGRMTAGNDLKCCDLKVRSWDELDTLMRNDVAASCGCVEDVAGRVEVRDGSSRDEWGLVKGVGCRTFPTWIVQCTVTLPQSVVGPSLGMECNGPAAIANAKNGQTNSRRKRAILMMSTEEQFDYQVNPSWCLSLDKKWQKIVKRKGHSERHSTVLAELSSPRLSSGGPFLITIGDFYISTCISACGDEIITTDDITIATRFYFQMPHDRFTADGDDCEDSTNLLRDPHSGFYIFCRSRHGQLLYFTADSKCDGVSLVASVPSPVARGQFFLKHPGTRKLTSLCQWPQHALHVVRKTAYTRRHQYLVMNRKTLRISTVFMSDDLGDGKRIDCQFRIRRPQVRIRTQRGSVKNPTS